MMKFSIVTVSYNAEELIENTIKSVLDQQFEDFEYIIIDGASTDKTASIIKKYDTELSYWVSEKDTGIYNAMNKAVSKSKGEWILFLNAGDTFSNDDVLNRVAATCQSENDFIYGDRHRVNSAGNRTYEKAGDLSNAFNREVIFHQSLFTKRELLVDRPYLESYKLAADYEFILYALNLGKKFVYVDLSISDFLEGGRSRQNHLLAKVEAIKASLHYRSDINLVRKNYYLENIVLQNIGFYLNKTIQLAKKRNPNFSIKAHNCGRGIKISANNPSIEFERLLEVINPALLVSEPSSSKDYLSKAYNIFKMKISNFFRQNKNTDKIHTYKIDKPSNTNQKKCDIKVSVVTVCYNAADLLETTIKSVLSQNYENIEYIVIDGASADSTQEILNKYNHKLFKIISEPDNGIYYAMNKAIDLVTGDYVIYMNAGDYFHNDEIITHVFSERSSLTDLIYGGRIYQKSDGTSTYQPANKLDTVFYRIPYCHQSLFLKTSVLKMFTFNTTYRFAADYDQSVRLFLNGCSTTILNEPICVFVQGGASESGIRPYLEAIKILLDNTNDKEIIAKNSYFSAFQRSAPKLLNSVIERKS